MVNQVIELGGGFILQRFTHKVKDGGPYSLVRKDVLSRDRTQSNLCYFENCVEDRTDRKDQ